MPFPWTEPKVNEAINRLSYQWESYDLLVEADRLTDAGQAELWFYHNNGTSNKLLHIAKVNLLSSSTMTQLAKRMSSYSENPDDIPWAQVLTCITKTSMEYQRRGEPGVLLQPVSAEKLKPVFYIEPLIIRGVPNILFGEKGVNKTTLGLTAMGLIEIGADSDDSPCGLVPGLTGRTGMLDWEGTRELTDYTLARLIEGQTIPYFELNYLRCKHPLSDEIDRVANFIHDKRIEVLLIDSLGQAAGSDKFDSSGKSAALRFFECLRQLNVTSLIIAQTSKSEEGKKTIYGCYSADTEVLTDTGWKRHTDIQDNDLIICYDPDDKCLRQEHFTKRWEYDYDGQMLHIKHKATEALITPNHKVLTTNHGEIPAEALTHFINPAYKLPYNTLFKRQRRGRYQKRFKLAPNTKWLNMESWLAFLGYWISEGSTTKSSVALTQTEGQTFESMKQCLAELQFPYTLQKREKEGWKPCYQINIAGNAGQRNSLYTKTLMKCSRRQKYGQRHLLKEWLEAHCGKGVTNKRIPSFVWDLPRKQQSILFNALIEGDGHLYQAGHRVYTTISKQLADDIQRLAMLIGCGSQLTHRERGGNSAIQYELLISKSERQTITIARRNTEWVDYNGKVYCLTVPTGYYVTRYNGRVAILGNSTFFTYYARNIFALQSKGDDLSSDRLHLALFHQEGNYTQKYQPIGFCVDFTDTTIKIASEPVSVSKFLERASQTKMMLELLQTGAKTVNAISAELELPDNRIRVMLSRAKKRKLVIDLGSGLWGLVTQAEQSGHGL